MTLLEAVKSDLPWKRNKWDFWLKKDGRTQRFYLLGDNKIEIAWSPLFEDIIATDYELQQPESNLKQIVLKGWIYTYSTGSQASLFWEEHPNPHSKVAPALDSNGKQLTMEVFIHEND